jgi:hypothetical protein
MLGKRVLSYRKQTWELADYPIEVRQQEIDLTLPPHMKQHQYWARILGWLVDGGGDTEQEARAALAQAFIESRAKMLDDGKAVPRPGTRVPIQFASQERVSSNKELEQDFIQRVLQLEWAFISDESSLWHFHCDENNSVLLARIREAYGVDVSDIESGNIAEILDRIDQERSRSAYS